MNIFEIGLRGWKESLFVGLMLSVVASSHAVERTLAIEAPETIAAGEIASVTISASTDAGVAEQVGFLQVESSMDGGNTWTPVCYLHDSGPRVVQPAQFQAGVAGREIMIRARAAFRSGLAGDVDYRGAALLWARSWQAWETPPAKHATIRVVEK